MDKIKMGIIGVAGRGNLADHWQASGRTRIAAGADIVNSYLARFRADFGDDVFVTTDYRELLARTDIDAVAITSPDYCHEEQAVAALEAGKHVFLEKPMAISIESCDRILRAWKASGRQLMIGFNMRHMSMFRRMKEIADSGAIGEIRAAWCRHTVGMGGPFYYHDWHANSLNSNSLLLQKGCHDIDVIHWITGRYTKRTSAFGSLDYFGGARPNDLRCNDCAQRAGCKEFLHSDSFEGRPTYCAFRREVNVEDNYVMIMDLEGGVKASYLECHFTADGQRNYMFIGTEGQMENSELEGKVWVKLREKGGALKQTEADTVYNFAPERGPHGDADRRICDDFIDVVTSGKAPTATPVAGRMSVAAGCAATESLRSGGRVVEVPPIDWQGEGAVLAVPAALDAGN